MHEERAPDDEPRERAPIDDNDALTPVSGEPVARGEGGHGHGVWAEPVRHFRVAEAPEGATNLNVEGREPAGAQQGFGQLWRKRYRVRLDDVEVSPHRVIDTWKGEFGSFWPEGNRFFGPARGIEAGDVALLNLKPIRGAGSLLATGVRVIYADDESFTFMNPQGHMFAGWITFSADRDGEGMTYAQVEVLIRTSDPAWDLAMTLFAFRKEDEFWRQTLRNLAARFGSRGEVWQTQRLLDPRRQWSRAGNIRYNAAMRSGLHVLAAPLRWAARRVSGGEAEKAA